MSDADFRTVYIMAFAAAFMSTFLWITGCAFHARTDPPEILVSVGDAYTLTCDTELVDGECPNGHEVRGGHISEAVGGVLVSAINAAASFVGAGPAPETTVIIQPQGEEIDGQTVRLERVR